MAQTAEAGTAGTGRKTEKRVHTAMPSLAGKRVVITGGTTGIGRAIANLLGSEGASLCICGRHPAELEDALRSIRESGGTVTGQLADVARPEDLARFFEQAADSLGGLDILIANAGLASGGIDEEGEKSWRYVVETNVLGYIGAVKEGLALLKKAGAGHIVLIGSLSADVRGAGSSVYVATKAAVQGFAEALRKEVNPLGIRVSLVEPGSVGTDMQDEPPGQQRDLIRKHEMLRAEDIAVAVHYVLTQPARCDVVELKIRPHLQLI